MRIENPNLINTEIIFDKINDLKEVSYHKSIANRQRKTYNEQRSNTDLLENKILIDIDYKQKIILGEGSRQLNSEFFQGNKKNAFVWVSEYIMLT